VGLEAPFEPFLEIIDKRKAPPNHYNIFCSFDNRPFSIDVQLIFVDELP
jgi:hypothetical protein